MAKKFNWEDIAERLIENYRDGDNAAKSIGLSSRELQYIYREFRKIKKKKAVFFYLLEKIYDYYLEELTSKLKGIEEYAPEKYKEAIQKELELLRKQPEVIWCLKLEMLNKQIRGEKVDKPFQDL
jgi:5'-deoxynucleotidase YfbR-like HD superfamily hydrolase